MKKIGELQAFPLNETTWDDDWLQVKKASPNLSDWGMQTLSEGLRRSAKSVVLEPHYICKDHRNLYSNFYSKKFQVSSPFTERLHFFALENVNTTELLLFPEKYEKEYIGYSVIRPVAARCLGRTVLNPHKLKINTQNLYCLTADFRVHIGGRHFYATGYPYISQDSDVTVCAHSALWGVCRYLSEKYSVYAELYPFDLINLTELSSGRAFPYRGMTYSDYCSILSAFGSYPLILRMKQNPSAPNYEPGEFENLYTYVESGFPILASYWGHVVSLIGHTLDYNKSVEVNANGFIASSSFVKEFIVVDDNFPPYQLLGERSNPDNYGVRYSDTTYDINSIVTAVCPLPEKVFIPAEKARSRALEYYKEPLLKADLESTGNQPFVTRLFLTTNTAFKRRNIQRSIDNGNIDRISFFVSKLNLPHFVWVMEVGPLNLYKQGYCTSELILDSTASEAEDATIYMRIGNKLILGGQQNIIKDCPIKFKQFTHNLGEK